MGEDLVDEFLFRSVIEENRELECWVPRYGDFEKIMALASEFFMSAEISRQVRGFDILRWAPAPAGNEQVEYLLLDGFVLTNEEKSQILRDRAAEVLHERGKADWLSVPLRSSQYTEEVTWWRTLLHAIVPAKLRLAKPSKRSRLIHALGHIRNTFGPDLETIESLNTSDRRYVRLSAASQLIWAYRTEFAIVVAFSYIAAQLGSAVISSLFGGSLPYSMLSLIGTVVWGFYVLLRGRLDGYPVAEAAYRRAGLWAGLLTQGIYVLGEAIPASVRLILGICFLVAGAEGVDGLMLLVGVARIGMESILRLSTILSMPIFAVALRVSPTAPRRMRALLRYALSGTLVATVLMIVRDLLLLEGLRLLDAPASFLRGTAVSFVCFLGFHLALQAAFDSNFLYPEDSTRQDSSKTIRKHVKMDASK